MLLFNLLRVWLFILFVADAPWVVWFNYIGSDTIEDLADYEIIRLIAVFLPLKAFSLVVERLLSSVIFFKEFEASGAKPNMWIVVLKLRRCEPLKAFLCGMSKFWFTLGVWTAVRTRLCLLVVKIAFALASSEPRPVLRKLWRRLRAACSTYLMLPLATA